MAITIHKTADVSPDAMIGPNTTIKNNTVILGGVEIGQNSYIGHNVVIHSGVKIGENAYVNDGCVLGREPRSGAYSKRKTGKVGALDIGNNCVVGVYAIIYAGTRIGSNVLFGDFASVRENVVVGDTTIIGRLVMIEPNTKIGNRVKIQTGSHITGDSTIEDGVFFGDEVSTANDNALGRGTAESQKGFYAKKGARIGSNATLLPGVVIGENSIVAAGSVVTRDVPDHKLVMGVPARVVRDAK